MGGQQPNDKDSKNKNRTVNKGGGKKVNDTINGGKKTFKKNNVALDNFNWKHKKPVEYVKFFSKNIFRNPDILNKKEGGIAIWYPKNNETITLENHKLPNIFAEHWCRDEYINHKCPSEHHDFFYSFIKIDLNDKYWSDVLSVSGSVGYDPLKHMLYARCASIEANIATLCTCVMINNGDLTIKQVQKKQIYGEMINSTSNFNSVKMMYEYLYKNLPKNVPQTGYWNIAFPKYAKSSNC